MSSRAAAAWPQIKAYHEQGRSEAFISKATGVSRPDVQDAIRAHERGKEALCPTPSAEVEEDA